MKCPALRRNDQPRPVRHARRRRRAEMFRPERSAPTLLISWAARGTPPPPTRSCHAPFDPDFGHGPATR
jgi:hypothetical protein